MLGNNSTYPAQLCGVFYPPFQSTVFAVNLITVCVTNIMFAFLGTFLNSLVIYVFFKSSFLRNKVCYFLVAVLSLNDLAVVFIVHPLSVLYFISEFTHKGVCGYEMLYNTVRHLLCSCSNYVLLVMTIERYIAVAYPYFYQRCVSRRRIACLVGIFWFSTVGLWLLGAHVMSTKSIIVFFQLALFFILSFLLYLRIFTIARKKRDTHIPNSQQSREHKKNRLKDFKLSSVYVLVTVSFTFCYCPTLLSYGLEYLKIDHHSKSHASLLHFQIWARTFVTMNSTFNCLIFFWKNSILRRESRKIRKRVKLPKSLSQCFRR